MHTEETRHTWICDSCHFNTIGTRHRPHGWGYISIDPGLGVQADLCSFCLRKALKLLGLYLVHNDPSEVEL